MESFEDKKVEPVTQKFAIADFSPKKDGLVSRHEPQPDDWTFGFARDSPIAYAGTKLVSQVVPFMWPIFPENRRAFAEKGGGEQALDIGLDVAFLALTGGTGKLAGKGVRSLLTAGWKSPFKPGKGLVSLSTAEKAIPVGSRYESVSMLEKVKTEWKLGTEEAEALLQNVAKPRRIRIIQEDGSMKLEKASDKLNSLYGKSNRLSGKTAGKLHYWKVTPEYEQRADFYRKAWKKKITTLEKGVKPNEAALFEVNMERIFGRELAPKIKLEDASAKVMANVFAEALGESKWLAGINKLGAQWITPVWALPVRKAAGTGERLFGTMGIYTSVKGLFHKGNTYTFQQSYNYMVKLESAGFGKILKKTQGPSDEIMTGFTPAKHMNKKLMDEYKSVAVEIDNMSSTGQKEEAIAHYLNQQSADVRKLITDVHFPFLDDLYKDYAIHKLPIIFKDAKLTEEGKSLFRDQVYGAKGVSTRVSDIFSSIRDDTIGSKNERMHGILAELRSTFSDRRLYLPGTKEDDIASRIARITSELTPSTKGKVGFPNYLENYTMRVGSNNSSNIGKRANALGTRRAAWAHARKKETSFNDSNLSITRMLEARISSQARELFVTPEMDKQLGLIKALPKSYKEYFDHWLARMYGDPSSVDDSIADWLTKVSPASVSRLFLGGKETWTAERVRGLAHTINDFTYIGALGFKPYGAVRNLFQTFLTVPTDLGGIKDTYWMVKGFKRGAQKDTQELIRSYGAIAEYTEEIYQSSPMLKLGPMSGKVQLQSAQAFRDTSMWMFKNSDGFNRYVTGGAALEKWDHFANKLLVPGKKWNSKAFMRKMKFQGRDDNIRRSLEGIIGDIPSKNQADMAAAITTQVDKAKAVFVTDVIADTQWLYGIMDAPLINSRFGVVSKTGVIFQSWWMNYMAALEKWFLRTGSPEMRADRFATWLVSSAIAGELMVHGAGFKEHQARATVGLAPIPSQGFLPPTWAPLYHALGTVGNLATGEPEQVKQSFKRLTRSFEIFAPAGLQMGKMIRGGMKGGPEGLARSSVNYFGGTGERFILGR